MTLIKQKKFIPKYNPWHEPSQDKVDEEIKAKKVGWSIEKV